MLRERKVEIVDELADHLARSVMIIATDYRGLHAKQMAELRNALAKTGGEYHVVKNSLARFAAEKAAKSSIVDIIEGPTALAFCYDESLDLVKVLTQYMKTAELTSQIKGGLLRDRVLTSEEVGRLASLPSKEVLISQLIAQLQAPIRKLHNALNFPLQAILNVLQRKAEDPTVNRIE